ncbi:MAG TPA: bifunctional (p)ppGpp synthetase/guanosine-3',5'-bis(diphosphate) 3'-pyrophosphohydrolase [Candidatus Latescibacteria bacterium]|nr:bifunctional (p)ppGpp synthetase/guanosine-3',5'-bis(diphosphate) 3'-pyrophosphohydrolase [Candidatus Latescibacterota bacterium]
MERVKRRFAELLELLRPHYPPEGIELVEKAFALSKEAHIGQIRMSGEPFVSHCVEVAHILAELQMDPETVAAGLLHDVVEDTDVRLGRIRKEFGERVAELVDGVTRIAQNERKREERAGGKHPEAKQADYFRKFLLSMAKDLRVVLIKFADRLHNMRTISSLPPETQRYKALETLQVYVPMAHRFGMYMLKNELEDLSFKVLHPQEYREIERKVAMKRSERERRLEEIKVPLREALEGEGIEAEITGRAKHFYSIFQKMVEGGKSFEEIYDLMGIRMIVPTVGDCYTALGVVHRLFSHVEGRIKDYIAHPKPNGYQSLHTTVVVPGGQILEVQIRTPEMHRVAEMGIAAHWRYKEGKVGEDEQLEKHIRWIREVLERQKDARDPKEFMEDLKIELYQNEIFVFTPKGEIKALPKGATALDFAFSVHTDIGLHCYAAKVNGRLVPISTQLQSGDMVEILTSPNQKPHRDWLQFVATSKAKSRIKRWLKAEAYEDSVRLGEELLAKELKRHRLRPDEDELEELARSLGRRDLEHLHAGLGSGELSLGQVVHKLTGTEPKLQRTKDRPAPQGAGLKLKGINNVMIRAAACCCPLPGDEVFGFVTRGRGISVHRAECPNIERLVKDDGRWLPVEWEPDPERTYLARIFVRADDRKHLLEDIVQQISMMDINIRGVAGKASLGTAENIFEVDVHDRKELEDLMARIRKVRGVRGVQRLNAPPYPMRHRTKLS